MSYKNTVLSEILRHLSDGEWHTLFSLHDRFRISPMNILECINYLKKNDVIQVNEMNVRLNLIDDIKILGALRHALQDRYLIIENDENARFKKLKLEINQVYMPKMRLLSSNLVAETEKNT